MQGEVRGYTYTQANQRTLISQIDLRLYYKTVKLKIF